MAGAEQAAAQVHVRLGNVEDALRRLERLQEQRHPNLQSLNSPYFDPLRSDPRFQAAALRDVCKTSRFQGTRRAVENDRPH